MDYSQARLKRGESFIPITRISRMYFVDYVQSLEVKSTTKPVVKGTCNLHVSMYS